MKSIAFTFCTLAAYAGHYALSFIEQSPLPALTGTALFWLAVLESEKK